MLTRILEGSIEGGNEGQPLGGIEDMGMKGGGGIEGGGAMGGGMHLAAIRSIIARPPCLLIHIPKA